MRLEVRRPTGPPEDSVAMRVVVALAVEVGVLAVVLQGAVDPVAAAAALVLAPIGYAFSHARRHRGGFAVKVALAVGLVVALSQFLQAVGGLTTVEEARLPLASLFLWVQVLHAFDVPRRRDLAFSMVSSTTLIAMAGALSLTGGVISLLLVWAGLAAAWLWLSARPRPDEVTVPVAVRRIHSGRPVRLAAARSAFAAGTAAVVVGACLFLAMPRLPSTLVRTPPFSLGDGLQQPAGEGADAITNPGLPAAGGDGVVDFAPGGYPGFSAAMDLRARGALSDEIAFRVRADLPALWRADAFDTFDGQVWTASDDEQVSLSAGWGSDGAQVPMPTLGVTPDVFTRRLVQTFYLESDQPNVLFGADRIEEVFFPAGGLRADREGTVRAPIILDHGLVYSVISEVPIVPEAVLRALPDPDARSVRALRRYLQVPEGTPERVGDLARDITAVARNPYERALAVQAWLRTSTSYDLEVAREPDGVDAVDHFLFETRRGFCEHIASAMAILLREVGVPTRIATGFGPGQRNPLTGYWEVRQSDAHAWVEVLLPEVGWISFDPTFGVPAADGGWSSRFIAPEVLAAIGRTIAASVPESVKTTVAAAIRGARSAAGSWPVAAALALLAGLSLVLLRRRRHRPARAQPPPDDLGHAFEDLVEALGVAGHRRAPSDTPREVLRAVEQAGDLPDEVAGHARTVVDAFERGRFAPPRARPSDADVMRARAAAARVKDLVGHR